MEARISASRSPIGGGGDGAAFLEARISASRLPMGGGGGDAFSRRIIGGATTVGLTVCLAGCW